VSRNVLLIFRYSQRHIFSPSPYLASLGISTLVWKSDSAAQRRK